MINLPLCSTVNNMEIIHRGNIDEFSRKEVQHKNTGNTSSNQRYQLLYKTVMKKDEPTIRIFDCEVINTSSYNADYGNYFRIFSRFTVTDDGGKRIYNNLIDDYACEKHYINGLSVKCYVKETSTSYSVYVLAKTEETSTAYRVIPRFIFNDDDFENIQLSGDVFTESEFSVFISDKEECSVESNKRFNNIYLTDLVNITGKLNTHLLPAKTGGTNGRDLGSTSERFRGCYFSNFIGLPSQSTTGRPTTTSNPPVFDGMTIFDSSLAKIITYWKGNWYANGEIV